MKDEIAIPIIFIIAFFVAMSTLAAGDTNNPMPEVGLPVTLDSFNPFLLVDNLPHIPNLNIRFVSGGTGCAWWDIACWAVTVAEATLNIAFAIADGVIWFVNLLINVVGVPVLLFINFATIFFFPAWPVFALNGVFMLTIGYLMSIGFGLAIILWAYDKVPLPFVMRGG